MARRVRGQRRDAERVLQVERHALTEDRIATLVDRTSGPALPLGDDLESRYGGPLRFADRGRPYVFANFVETLDGVVSFAVPGHESAKVVSAGHPADRFVLGLLRAAADAVVVGAGTLRKEPGVVWSPRAPFPEAGEAFARMREAMGRPAQPLTVLVTRSGDVDLRAPAFRPEMSVLILTSREGAARIGSTPENVRVRVMERSTSAEIVAAAAEASGGGAILTEGGPNLFGQLLRDGVVDELFLTIAPRFAGRSAEHRRTALVEGAAFDPERAPATRLLSAKVAGDLLLLRYATR